MEYGIIKIMRFRSISNSLKSLSSVRHYADLPERRTSGETQIVVGNLYPKLLPQYWSERAALKKQRKDYGIRASLKSSGHYLKFLQSLRDLPINFTEIFLYLKERAERKNVISQKFIIERELTLRPDLAAAHFIVYRGGSVKFLGQQNWVGMREKKRTLPFTYVPGYHVEGIKAENTKLNYEGLKNLRKLKYLNYLSFRGLEEVNDWFLDWVSKEYYSSLKYLDLSNCVNVTYRGLSCFYRFEKLQSLNLEGVPDTPQLKLACLMLLDIKPYLEIKGIELDIPDKVEPVNIEETKFISEKTEPVPEETKNTSEQTKQASKI